MARTNEESSTPIQDPAPAPSSNPPAVNRSVVSYGSARSVSSENRSIPASFQDFARNTDDAEDRQSVPTTDEYRAAFQQVMHQYEDLLSYVVSGRAKRMAEVSRQMERTNLVFMSVELYPPANRPTILSLIEEQRNDISVKQKEIQVLDENVEGERSRLQSELVLALNTVPAPDLNQLVLEFGWPTVDVCQDLNLPYEYVLMARGTYNPTRIATNDNNEKIIVQEENDKITQLLQRISLLEDSLNRQTNGNASSTQRKSTKPAIDKSESGDALPIEAKRQMFGERRKRTKIPQFTSGNSEAAQQWLQRYEVLCEYLGFSEKEKAEELAAVLDGAALHWYIGLAHDDKRDWITLKQQFLRQHGGGANPAIAALAELKEIRQGNKSMRVFGPIITDLLQRAQIFSADVQLDYFKDRIHPELLKAIIYRGPTTLMDAINIATEVEQALLKSMGKSSNGNLSSVYTPNNTTTTTNYGISSSGSHNTNTDQQNFQRHNNGNNNFKNNRRYNNNDKRQQQRGESRKCFNCNKIGHISKDCRSPKRHRENKTNQQTIHNDDKDEMDNIFDHLMQQNQQTTPTPVNTLQFSINATTKNNSIKQNCLIDTGSTLSSIRQSTATRLGLYEFNTQPRRIEYGNGGLQLTTKKAIFEFKINNLPTRAFLYIVEKQNEEVILGMDWMTYEDIVLHPKTKTITKNSSEQQNLQQVQHDEQTNDEITNEEFLAQTILNEFPKLIPNDNGPQTVTNAPYMHRIDTGDALPVHVRDYRRPFAENEQIKKEVDEMLRKKVIEPSTSAWCSPVVMIKKHDESWRFCVDFRKLNAVTVKDKFPIGNLNELLDKLHGCKYLSTIDLKSGFWQIPMDPRDAHKTAFIANGALYQFKVLPFGCVTGPNSFSRFMHGVIQNLPRVMVYLDDVICFSRTKEEHEQDLRALLQRLSEYNLKISVKKCRFFKKEVKYLGFIVSSNGIRSDPEKIEAIKEWPTPTTVKALQRFLGFCAFYHRFIKNLSQTAAPMYALLRKDAPFVWSKEADQAFITLKIIIMTLPTLAYPDPHKPYDVHTDASMFGLGAIIVQNGRPVAFASRTLTPAEKNYSTTEQEALCVVYALNHFYPYLYGAVFTIYTDHAALKCILSKKEPKGRIARWVLAIQAFQFTIIHRKGIANKDADALSRRDQVNNQQVSVSNGSYGSSSYDSSSGERDDEDTNDPEISIQNFKCYQKDDQRIQVILKQGVKRPFLWVNEILYYEYDDKKQVPVLPARMVKTLLRHVHDAPTSGHFGVDKTLEKATQMAWWCSMKEDIKLWIQHCEKCQRFKTRTTSSVAPLKPIVPTRLGEIWAADIAILPISSKGNRYMLVMMEYLSKWVVTVALPSFDSDHVAQAILYEIVLKIGLPERLITDNGSNFVSDAMKNVCARLGIKRSMTSVESPQTDGLVERMNRTLKTSLAMAVDKEPHLWDEYLQFVTFAYNTSKQASTGFSPFQVLYGREAVLPLDKGLVVVPKTYETETWVNYLNKYLPILHGQVIENIKRAQGYQKKFYDKGVKVKYDYKVGDLISRQNLEKLTFPKERWSGPWIIVDKNDIEGRSWKIVKQDDPHKRVTTANVRHMRPWFSQDEFQEYSNLQATINAFNSGALFKGEAM